ncbi:hypothetical protein EVAR_92028_1 [Eumeta japonica]|uniref:Uncharacterized protein n=1 Tax=Eumeta variegata TaxID=151549 RepID=A0A4C2A9W1_EUMVA|nr:hypothetical protein EVAR_92028_1 [Eumeta japonica]
MCGCEERRTGLRISNVPSAISNVQQSGLIGERRSRAPTHRANVRSRYELITRLHFRSMLSRTLLQYLAEPPLRYQNLVSWFVPKSLTQISNTSTITE